MLTVSIVRCRARFNRYGCEARLLRPDGSLARIAFPIVGGGFIVDDARLAFYGNDGRRVRAQARQWANAHSRND